MFYTLPETISKYIDQFSGRAWILPEILKWYENSTKPLFLITGDPGTGKSMVTAWLAGSGSLPADLAPGEKLPEHLMFKGLSPRQQLEHLRKLVKAVYFCEAASDSTDPKELTRQMATQIGRNVPEFLEVPLTVLSDRGQINVYQYIEKVAEGGSVIGVSMPGGPSEELNFNQILRDPLRRLYEDGYTERVLLLIDALDETLTYTGGTNIVQLLAKLTGLPPQVRILATTRPDERVLKSFYQVPRRDLVENAPPDAEDVRHFAFARLPEGLGEPRRSDLAKQVGEASEGIFLYGRLVVEDILVDLEKGTLPAKITFPSGLEGYYNQFLERELGKDIDRWREIYCPVLGVVSVAQGEGLNAEQVENMTRQDVEKIILACLQYMDGNYPEGPFRVFHRSFADFLLESKANKLYRVNASKMHALITDYYYGLHNGSPPLSKWDEYALFYITAHLEGASQLKDEQKRHVQAERLVQLVQDPMFQKRFRRKTNDEVQMKHIILSAVRAAAADTKEEALELLLGAVRYSQKHRHDWLQPGPIFEMAEKGDLDDAINQLTAFPLEAQWVRAASLVLAWLATPKSPNKAEVMLKHMESQADRTDLEVKLGARLDAAMKDNPPNLEFLPGAPDRFVLDQILVRLGGQRIGEELIGNITSGYDLHPYPQIAAVLGELVEPGSGDSVPVFLAQQDGPFLVAYAVANQGEGLAIFQRYLDLHAANPYLYYRNASLWLLIDFVLRHPDSAWTLQALKSLFLAALDVEGKAFEEALELALLALQARAGNDESRQALDDRWAAEEMRIQNLTDERYQSDTWGLHKRRLCALAQAYLLLPGGEGTVKKLFRRANKLPRGFAGFMYSAWLNLAEAVRMCGLEDSFSITSALRNALKSAHNVQDSVFCARTTARVNAMQMRWWPLPEKPDLEDLVEEFNQQPMAGEFTALHIVGEKFRYREKNDDKLPLEGVLLTGNTLRALAEAFRLPLADFIAANAQQGWDADSRIKKGTPVNVPDPDFTPLLAARLAAEVAVADWLFPNEKRAMIQSLVFAAIHDRTVQDTILARLLLASVPTDQSLLERLMPLAQQVYAQFPDITAGSDI